MPGRPDKATEESEEMPGSVEPVGPLGSLVRCAPLEPIRYVDRELTRPDGTKLRVKVPVYPPFRLEERPAPKAPGEMRKRAPEQKKAS